MIPANEIAPRFSRDVRQVLRASEVGIRWADNIGPEVTCRYDNAAVTVPVPSGASPRYLVVRAVDRTTNAIECGCRIVWTFERGMLQVTSIDVSEPTHEYDVTIALMMG